VLNGSAARWLLHGLGLREADTQTTAAERACLSRHAAGKKRLVEIGVMHGVTAAVLRGAMSADGVLTAIDPHPPGRLGVSFERAIARREIGAVRRGRAVLERRYSADAARAWREAIDFLFVDGDHSWPGIDADWRAWTPFVERGGLVALHDSRPVPGRAELDSVRFTRDVVLTDPRFEVIDAVDTLTVLKRR
jgi:predicted O-methyltransferase YrrM